MTRGRLGRGLAALCLGLGLAGGTAAPALAADADGPGVEPVDLRYMNRVVYTLRAPVAGVSPEQRVEGALRRLRNLPLDATARPVERIDEWRNDERVIVLRAGGATLFTVFARDLDPDTGMTLDEMAAYSARRLDEAFAARRALHDPARVAEGVAWSLAGLGLVLAIAWLAWRARGALTRRLEQVVQTEAATHRLFGMDWSDLGLRAVAPLTLGLGLAAMALLAYSWVAHAFRQFPATLPLAAEMRRFLADGAAGLLGAVWGALPDLATILAIVAIARVVVWVVDHVFTAVIAGRLRIPGVHRETARATRRLVVFAVWGLALAAAYPFIPGSDSAVFRGLSVFLGAMFTLGSSGVVSQWMHGLVIVYARALRAGDHVRCGGHEGVVQELGALSVKIIDARGDEVTLPNGTIVQGAIVNHSRHAPGSAVRGAVRLSLGYDVPWARVHALLEEAARRTDGLRIPPAPRVVERVLGDFTVEYELVVEIASARMRPATLSALRRSILDVFDEAGVAIASPQLYTHVEAAPRSPAAVADADADAPAAAGQEIAR